MSKTYNSTNAVFPNSLAPKAIKDLPEYGEQVVSAILAATSEYRTSLREEIFQNRKFVDAKQSLKEYLDEMDIDGQQMYANISYKPRPVIQKFLKIVVEGYVLKNEYPDVKSTSKHIQTRKDKKLSDAEFRMTYGSSVKELEQSAGMQLEDPKDFTPKTPEHLSIYQTLSDKEKEELMMQDIVSFALRDNNIKSLKKSFLTEQFINQVCGYYNHIDELGRLDVVLIQGEDGIYDHSHREIFTDVGYAGRFLRMKVSEARARFSLKGMSEKDLFDCAKSSMGKYGNDRSALKWTEDYRFSDTRPYDNRTIELVHIWWRTSQIVGLADGYEAGKSIREISTSPEKIDWTSRKSESLFLTKKFPETAYEGFFLASNNKCLEWGEQRNVLRKGLDKQVLLCPYIYAMPYNTGRQRVPSSTAMILDSVKNMDIAILKIKQVIVQMAPDDLNIDLESIMNIDLGDGELEPLTVLTIRQQTGKLFWRSKSEDGQKTYDAPVRQGNSSVTERLNSLINWYNTELANIKDYLGINDFRDGSATQARTGFRFQQAQLDASNTATYFMYESFVNATDELVKQIGIRIWDAFNYGTVNEGYAEYLGRENIEWVQSMKELTGSSYDLSFSMGLSDSDKANIEAKIQAAVDKGTLELPDALLLEDVEDPKKAAKLLSYMYTMRRQERMEEAQANQKSAADYSAQAGVAVEKAKQETGKLLADMEMAKEKERGKNDQLLALQKTALTLMEESFKTGKQIPPEFAGFVERVLEGVELKNQVDAEVATQEAEAMQQQMQQEAIAQELQAGIQSGDITEEEAAQLAQENGLA